MITNKIVSQNTRKLLYQHGYHVQVSKGKHNRMGLKRRGKVERRDKSTLPIKIVDGYNTVQYIGIVRHFIQKKYNLKINELEVLLYLYPLGLWSKKDYKEFPHGYSTKKLQSFIDKGYIIEVFDLPKYKQTQNAYKLSPLAKKIVTQFYEYLMLEKPIPESGLVNPLFKEDASNVDNKKALAIAKLNQKTLNRKTPTPGYFHAINKIKEGVRKVPEESRQEVKERIQRLKRARRLEAAKQRLLREGNSES